MNLLLDTMKMFLFRMNRLQCRTRKQMKKQTIRNEMPVELLSGNNRKAVFPVVIVFILFAISVCFLFDFFGFFELHLEPRIKDRIFYSAWFLAKLFLWMAEEKKQPGYEKRIIRHGSVPAILLTAVKLLLTIVFMLLHLHWLGFQLWEFHLKPDMEGNVLCLLVYLFWIPEVLLQWLQESEETGKEKAE